MRLTSYFPRSKWMMDEDIYDRHNERAEWLDLPYSMSWEIGFGQSDLNERTYSLWVVDETPKIAKDGETYVTGYIHGVSLRRPTDDPDFDPYPIEGDLEHPDNLPSGIQPAKTV